MAEEQVSAKITDGDPVQVQYDFGTDLDEAVEKFGAEVVFSRYKSAAVIDLQAYMRGLIRQEKNPDEIEEAAEAWAPGMRQPRGKSNQEKLSTLLDKMDPSVVQEMLEKHLEAATA